MRGVPGTEDQEDLIVSNKSVILHMHSWIIHSTHVFMHLPLISYPCTCSGYINSRHIWRVQNRIGRSQAMAKGPPVKRTSYQCVLVDRYKEEQRFPQCVLLQIFSQCSNAPDADAWIANQKSQSALSLTLLSDQVRVFRKLPRTPSLDAS